MNLKETQMRIGRKGMIGLVLAVMVIGLASAAVFTHYGTMSGDVQTDSPVYLYTAMWVDEYIDPDTQEVVVGHYAKDQPVPIDGNGNLLFETHVPPVLNGESVLSYYFVVNDGLMSVDLLVVSGSDAEPEVTVTSDYDGAQTIVSGDEVLVTVTADIAQNTAPGTYTIHSVVSPDMSP